MEENERKNLRRVQVRMCIRSVLIVLGAVAMQFVAYMICIAAVTVKCYLDSEGDVMACLRSLQGYVLDTDLLLVSSLVSALLSGVWCGILYKKSSWREERVDYRRVFSGRNLLSIAGTSMGGCVVLSLLLSLAASWLPEAFESYNQVMDALTGGSLFISILYVLMIGPVSEELIFRGAILDRFYLAFPFFLANALQAALFGLYHMNLIQGLYAFCLGMVLGLIRQVAGSIFASMLAHMLFNSTSYLLGWILPEKTPAVVYAFVFCLALAACLAGGRSLLSRYSKMNGEEV